jgi:alpha-beta hydrolase superfamily lysophospholipase
MNRRKFLQAAPSTVALTISGALAQTTPSFASPEKVHNGIFEELVTAHTEDRLTQSGLVFSPSPRPTEQTAVVWIHGATANFYYPSYVAIARKMASNGYTFILGNTRMHDIGCVLSDHGDGSVVRGGSLWGLPSQEPLDIAAWIDVAEKKGRPSVVLVGHSAGGPAVRRYMAERVDKRVIGWAQASVGLALWPPKAESDRLKTATEMVAAGNGQDFLPDFRLSAGTFLDYARTPDDIRDFYGIECSKPAVTRVRTPLLAFYGSKNDVGSMADLERLRALMAKHSVGPVRVDTAVVQDGDHDYAGQEAQVASILANWVKALSSKAGR